MEMFDAVFIKVMPAFMVCGLILFPISIFGKFVLIAIFMKSLANGRVNPLVALMIGPSALMLSRMTGNTEKSAHRQPDLPENPLPPPDETFEH